MKRALAERAKQSSLPKGPSQPVIPQRTTPPPNSDPSIAPLGGDKNASYLSSSISPRASSSPDTPLSQPPLKIPRIERRQPQQEQQLQQQQPQPVVTTTSSGSSSSLSPPRIMSKGSNCINSTTGSKRQRSGEQRHEEDAEKGDRKRKTKNIEENDAEDDDEDDDASKQSAFYLKHQNRALATELKSLQFAVRQLETERDYRRKHCHAAVQALNSLQASWTQLETALLSSSAAAPHHAHSLMKPPDQDQSPGCLGSVPISTGTGASVELTAALAQALAAMGNSSNSIGEQEGEPHEGEGQKQEEQDDDDIVEETPSDSPTNNKVEEEQVRDRIRRKRGRPRKDATSAIKKKQGRGRRRMPEHHGLTSTTDGSSDIRLQHQLRLLDDLSQISANVAARAHVLQDWILPVLQQPSSVTAPGGSRSEDDDTEVRELREDARRLEGDCKVYEARVLELTASRDASLTRERRMRRNMYRLSSGIMTTDQVLKALDSTQEDDAELRTAAQLELALQKLQKQVGDARRPSTQGNVKREESPIAGVETLSNGVANTGVKDSKTEQDSVPLSRFQELECKATEAEKVAKTREASIKELTSKLEEKELQVTRLRTKQLSEEDAVKLQRLESMRLELESSKERVVDLDEQLSQTRQQWAQAVGNEKAVLQALDDLCHKHNKRWAQITETNVDEGCNENSGSPASAEHDAGSPCSTGDLGAKNSEELASKLMLDQSKQIAVLQHKLRQAMENVRQAESTRENLKDALVMNESLQTKLDEMKPKYAAAVQAASAASGRSSNSSSGDRGHASSSGNASGSSTPRDKDSSGGNDSNANSNSTSSKSESRWHREYRKVRKDLAAAIASKDSAKGKLERAEKERDGLMDANTRLLHQITEKDEMNAKSLSTILHLKSMTEHLETERDNMQAEASSASQLALAARLASNAKDRVSEEILAEKKLLEGQYEELQKKHAAAQAELDNMTSQWSDAAGKMITVSTELDNALKRCDELVEESTKRQEEIRSLIDAREKTEREADEAKQKLASVAAKQQKEAATAHNSLVSVGSNAASAGGFTVEQLSTQVAVLKGRLACPVCHYRDKECIIMRCRHMHCKQCVEERITNRSRKCPTCNNKFSDKDVEDVWLS